MQIIKTDYHSVICFNLDCSSTNESEKDGKSVLQKRDDLQLKKKPTSDEARCKLKLRV
jgi:hypothetical protein